MRYSAEKSHFTGKPEKKKKIRLDIKGLQLLDITKANEVYS